MPNNTAIKSPLVAGFMAAAMTLQSPTGHDIVYQGLLRGWFTTTWIQASIDVGRPISFQTLRENAEILAYHQNPETFVNNIKLLKGNFSFCLPFINEGNKDAPSAPQNYVACHGLGTRESEKSKKKSKKKPKPA